MKRLGSVLLLAGVVVVPILTFGAGPAGAAPGDTSASIVDFAFAPASIAVAVGATVTWHNTGAAPHTVSADDGSFNSSPSCPGTLSACIQPGAAFAHKFTTPGTFAYHCNVHANMTGRVVVTAAPTPTTTTPPTTVAPGPTTTGVTNSTTPVAGSTATTVVPQVLGQTAAPAPVAAPTPGLARTGDSHLVTWVLVGLGLVVAGFAVRALLRPGEVGRRSR